MLLVDYLHACRGLAVVDSLSNVDDVAVFCQSLSEKSKFCSIFCAFHAQNCHALTLQRVQTTNLSAHDVAYCPLLYSHIVLVGVASLVVFGTDGRV